MSISPFKHYVQINYLRSHHPLSLDDQITIRTSAFAPPANLLVTLQTGHYPMIATSSAFGRTQYAFDLGGHRSGRRGRLMQVSGIVKVIGCAVLRCGGSRLPARDGVNGDANIEVRGEHCVLCAGVWFEYNLR